MKQQEWQAAHRERNLDGNSLSRGCFLQLVFFPPTGDLWTGVLASPVPGETTAQPPAWQDSGPGQAPTHRGLVLFTVVTPGLRILLQADASLQHLSKVTVLPGFI